jgi:hypothetical protein
MVEDSKLGTAARAHQYQFSQETFVNPYWGLKHGRCAYMRL